MKVGHFIKFFASASALAVVATVAAPGNAQASPCYYEDPLYPGDWDYASGYPECEEAGGATNQIGRQLENAGDQIIQQQLQNQLGFAGAAAAFATPTGRLRRSEHDGLKINGTSLRTVGFETREGSVFANGSYDLPGTYFGGRVRVTGLFGYDRLTQDGDGGAFKTEIDSFIYGGSYLWSMGKFYSMSMIIGVSGDADGSNAGGNYNYDVSGYFTNSIYGYTFDLSGPWKFDARVNLGHYDVNTDRFVIPGGGQVIKGASENWHAGITGTLFQIVEVSGGVMRPYFLASYKNVFDEDIKVKGDFTASFDQADDFGKVEVGFDYVQGILTYGAAAYTEFSADEETIGGRLGVSVKFN